jgi:hypothetical protein
MFEIVLGIEFYIYIETALKSVLERKKIFIFELISKQSFELFKQKKKKKKESKSAF